MPRLFVGDADAQWQSQLRTDAQAVKTPLADDVDHTIRYEVVERAPIDDATTQIGARHFEARNFDATPIELRRQVDRCARAVDNYESRRRRNFVDTLPRRDVGRRVVSDDREQSRARILDSESSQGVGGVTGTTTFDFFGSHLEAFDALDGGPDHFDTICSTRDGARPRLLPGIVGDHEDDLVE